MKVLIQPGVTSWHAPQKWRRLDVTRFLQSFQYIYKYVSVYDDRKRYDDNTISKLERKTTISIHPSMYVCINVSKG